MKKIDLRNAGVPNYGDWQVLISFLPLTFLFFRSTSTWNFWVRP